MKIRGVVVGLCCALLSVPVLSESNLSHSISDTHSSPISAGMKVVPDLARRLAKFRQVEVPVTAGLSAREYQLVLKLVDASRCLDEIYWQQVDPKGFELYKSLKNSSNSRDAQLRRYLWINGSRFDLLQENQPFVGAAAMLPGRDFYPENVTRKQIESYVKAHPEKRAELYSPTTVVRWKGSELVGVPYHLEYRSYLEPAAADLRAAAALSDDPAFANYLRLRADALLNDDYFASDLAWLGLKQPRIDLIFAPYETYEDCLLGVKATYGASIMVRDEANSRRIATFQKYVAEIQDALPLPQRDRPSKRGLQTPMDVVDAPFRAGDLGHGYQAVADNLPNDARILEQKGSKKLFFKNFMDARVNYVILPLARYMMPAGQADLASAEGYLLGTIMHEICHGLGPAFAHDSSGKKIGIREAIGPAFNGLEEAKADVVGMFSLKWLVDHGVLPKEKLNEYYASYVAGNFRTMRFGAAEAHGRAEMMEFNYYLEHGAIRRNPSGQYQIDFQRLPAQIESLAKELLEMEATGDRARTEAWFQKYDVISPDLQQSLGRAGSVPVDVDPIFELAKGTSL